MVDVGTDDDFFALGGDSLMALQIAAKLRSAGYALSVRSIFATPRLAELAAAAVPIEASPAIDRGQSDDRPAPLTPIQRWFVARNLPQSRHYNQAVAFATAEPLELARLETALTVVADAHPALRMAVETDLDAHQRPMPIDVLVPPAWFDLRALPEQLRQRTIHQKLEELQHALDPAAGRVLRAVVFRMGGDQPDLLVLIAHHLVIDARSWLILAEDLAAAYRGAAIAPAIGFSDWARALAEAKTSTDGWSEYLTGAIGTLPCDRSVATNAESDAAEFTLSLTGTRSRALARWRGGRTGRWLSDAVLASLGLVLGEWTGHKRVLIDVEGTGRDVPASFPDPSRTIGWLTTLAPVVVPHHPQESRNARLAVAVASIGAAPADWTYAIKETKGPRSGAALCVNFLGRLAEQNYIGEFFKPVAFDTGPLRGPDNPRAHLIDLEIESGADVLGLTWRYAASAFDTATMEAVRATASRSSHQHSGIVTMNFDLFNNAEAIVRLTPLQLAMVAHTKLASAGASIGQMSVRLRGKLDPARFGVAFQQLVDRHAALRTLFVAEDVEEPLQIVLAAAPITIVTTDLTGRADAEGHLDAFLAADRRTPFALDRPPLMRIALFKLGAELWQLVLTRHHLIMDGWSANLLLRELEILLAGESLPGPAKPFHYFVDWLDRRDNAAVNAFWQNQLKDACEGTSLLPGERLMGGEVPAALQEIIRPLGATLMALLVATARASGLSVQTFFAGAWALLAARYAGANVVQFGLTVTGRPEHLPDIDGSVGLFMDIVPIRVAVDDTVAVDRWLKNVQQQLADAARHPAYRHSGAEPARWSGGRRKSVQSHSRSRGLWDAERAADRVGNRRLQVCRSDQFRAQYRRCAGGRRRAPCSGVRSGAARAGRDGTPARYF